MPFARVMFGLWKGNRSLMSILLLLLLYKLIKQSKTQSLSHPLILKIALLGNQKAELNTVQCVHQGRTSRCAQSSWLENPSISLFLMFALNEALHFEGNTDWIQYWYIHFPTFLPPAEQSY